MVKVCDCFPELKDITEAREQRYRAHPEKPAELWKEAVKGVGPTVIKEAFQNLTPNDTWQNFYQENKKFLAAEVNFWSPFEGEALADGKPRDPAA